MERKKVAIVSSFFRHGQWRGIMRYGQKVGWICQRFTAENLERLEVWEPDGVVFQIDEYDKPLLGYIRACKASRVGLRAALGIENETPLVLPDLAEFGREVARHFAANNYRRLCYLGPASDEMSNPGATHFQGMQEVAEEQGIELEGVFLDQRGTWRKLGLERREKLTTGWERFWELGPNLIERLLGYGEPVGLFSAFAEPAMEFIEMLAEHTVKVPEQIGMVAQTEDGLTGTVTKVPLSCIVPDYERQGYEAGNLLGRAMDGEKLAANHREYMSEHQFIVRESSDRMVSSNPEAGVMIDYIRRNFQRRDFSPDAVADMMGCSLRSVQICFRKSFQRGVADIIRHYRTQHASKLLTGTDLRLQEIISKCGFSGPHQFERAMKKAYGMNPSAYRHVAKSEPKKF